MQIRRSGCSGLLSLILIGGAVLSFLAVYAQRILGQAEAGCRVGYVYDGDTIAMECGRGEITARVMGLDAPETVRARCPEERAAGARATERLRALVAGGAVRITCHGEDKYRRALIRLRVDDVDVARTLVREDLAVRYSGGTRIDWCARLAR